MSSYEGLEGSGPRAMETNEAALKKVLADMKALEVRSQNGEDVSAEMRRLIEMRDRLKTDQGLIESAGM